jgi:hypothetical protein
MHQSYDINTRGICPLRHLYMQLWLPRRYLTSIWDDLDIDHCMGDSRTVSYNLDCCKTLPWIARTINRMDCPGLFRGISKESCVLLRKVRSWFQCHYLSRYIKLATSFVAVSSLQLSGFSPQLLVCQPTTDICNWLILIISTVLDFRDKWGLSWRSIYPSRADVYIGTTPHPWSSRILCQPRH